MEIYMVTPYDGIVHGSEERLVSSEEERLDVMIKRQKRWGGGRRLRPHDRAIFETPLKRLLRMNVDDKMGWLENIAAARQRRFSGPRVPTL